MARKGPVPPRRARLGARLRELRAHRFRYASGLARALDSPDDRWHQTKVSKIELGRQLPTAEELDAWVEAVGGTGEDRAEIGDLLAAARLDYRTWGDAWRSPGGIAAVQDEVAQQDAAATRIGEYQPAIVPGLAQTPAYARELLSSAAGPTLVGADPESIEEKVTAQDRRQQALYRPGKRVEIVMGEAALHTRFGSVDTLAGQLDRLAMLSGLANVTVGILRFDVPSPVLPLAGFAINDADVVWVETLTGEQRLDDPVEIAAYDAAFTAALRSAATGADAAAAIRERLALLRA